MATPLCPNCGAKVEATATECKKCGHDLTAPAKRGLPTWPVALLIVGAIMVVVGLVAYSQGVTLIGLVLAAVGGWTWRFRIRRDRALGR
jgi:uncharacterized protein (DUF983 family)